MPETQNLSLIFKEIPSSFPEPGKHLTTENRPIDLDASPPPNGLLVRNFYASFDPYQRGRMRDSKIQSYSPAFPLNEPIANAAISQILTSANDKYKQGDVVLVMSCPTQEYSVLTADHVEKGVFPLHNPYKLDVKLFLGALGMPGLTAYSSLYNIGAPKKGETIFISAASGAVGQIVGQLAKHEGLKVIGSVGDDEKLKYIEQELGFDGGFNYKKEKPSEALKRLAPEGLDIYYENVGGEQLEAAINAMKNHGRISMLLFGHAIISSPTFLPSSIHPSHNQTNPNPHQSPAA